MELEQKLDLLGGAAAEEVDTSSRTRDSLGNLGDDVSQCQTCAANPDASLVTHRATQPIAPDTIRPRPRDLKPWLSTVIRGDGKPIPIVKTLMTSACEKDCYYCPTRRGRNSLRRETFKPEELAAGFNIIHKKGIAEGLFLSSGVIGGGTRTMEKTIAAIEILRERYDFRGYVHLKVMPGAERGAIERALQLADRVSVNLEAPNTERLAKLSSTKQFLDELLEPLRVVRELQAQHPEYARVSLTTQFVVGGADESDREILSTSAKLYHQLRLARIYYSAFRPIVDTPLENHAPTAPLREHRLYQTDFLLRQYGFTYADLIFDDSGNLPTEVDPKTMWATHHPEKFPLELNRASREELLRVPGLGPKSVARVLQQRGKDRVNSIKELAGLGADAKRAAPFILLNGKQPAHQLPLFDTFQFHQS